MPTEAGLGKSENLLNQQKGLPGSLHWRAGQSSHLRPDHRLLLQWWGPSQGWQKAEKKKKPRRQ